MIRSVLLVMALLFAGCATPVEDGPAAFTPAEGNGAPAALAACPARPDHLPDDTAPGEVMETVVRLWRHTTAQDPVAGSTVLAVSPGWRPTGSLSLGHDCALAKAQTDEGGVARLWLPPGDVEILAGFGTTWHGSVTKITAGGWVDIVQYHAPEAKRNTCDLPERPPRLSEEQAFAPDLRPVDVGVFMGRAHGAPVAHEQVVAVHPSDEGPWELRDLRPTGNPCIAASARTAADGWATLWLPAGVPYRFVAEADKGAQAQSRIGEAPTELALRQTDPSEADIADCGEPEQPFRLPDDEQFALDLVPVTFAFEGSRPDRTAEVVALHRESERPWNTFDLRRFFTECVLAEAQTMGTTTTLWLASGQQFHAAVRPNFDYIGSAMMDLVATEGLVVELPLIRNEVTISATRTIQADEAPHEFSPALEPHNASVLAHLDTFHATVTWTNGIESWGDLRLRAKTGPTVITTSSGSHTPIEGQTQESISASISLDNHRCSLERNGLTFDIQHEGGLDTGPLEYTLEVVLRFEEGAPFDQPFAPKPCGD